MTSFPANPVDQQVFEINGKRYVYIASKTYWRAKINYLVPPIPQAELNLYKLSLMRQ